MKKADLERRGIKIPDLNNLTDKEKEEMAKLTPYERWMSKFFLKHPRILNYMMKRTMKKYGIEDEDEKPNKAHVSPPKKKR